MSVEAWFQAMMAGGGAVSNWILASGFWDDSKEWVDSENWID